MSQAQALQIVCPACEQTISEPDADRHGPMESERPCPHCGYRFVWAAQARGTRESFELPWRGLVDRLPLPRAVTDHAARRISSEAPLPPVLAPLRAAARRATFPIAPEPQPPASNSSRPTMAEPESPPLAANDDAEDRLQPAYAHPSPEFTLRDSTVSASEAPSPTSRSRASMWPWVVTLVAIVGCMAVFVSVLIFNSMANRNSPVDPLAANPPEATGSNFAGSSEATSPTQIPRELFWPDFLESKPADLWNRVGPYLVGVQWPTAEGTRRATGVLVDTRGWLLLPGLSEAELVRAQILVAPSNPTETATQTAEIQSIVGRLEDPNWVIVQVDPHPFRAFADLKFDSIDSTATDGSATESPLIAAGWSLDQAWLVPLTASRSLRDLDRPLESSDGISPEIFGGFVLNDQATILGVLAPTTSDREPLQTRIIKPDVILGWLAEVRENPLDIPLTSLDAGRRSRDSEIPDNPTPLRAITEQPTVDPLEAEWARAARIHPITIDSLVRMEELSTVLLAAHGQILTPANYRRAAELAARIHEVERNEKATNIEAGLLRLLTDGCVTVRETWQRAAWPDDTELARTNQLAIDHLDIVEGFWGYGEVVEAAGLAPRIDEGDTVLMQLIGTEHRIAIPVSQGFDQLAVGSRWMVWGTTRPRLQLTEENSGAPQGAPVVRTLWLIEEPEVLIPGRPF